ncbi:phosphohydrolase [Massilia sp. G4R7]|uniref:Phosphohydrolase n=1 Tax=Massilia phyllostachyos TaxID=2898585 RepID=A0ABS8QEE5_9BURK|nr:phosphohydrolase [Massilia phyllostachyos]MCD2519526.1 phosphohydrolase [Massilia phyllostachyos]
MHNTPSAHEVRAWVRMPSGKRLDLLNPTPFDWDDADLALGLARTYRWGGHSAWPLPLSVAQHSIAVMLLRRALSPRPSPVQELRELLHDAEEGLLGFDAVSVIKPFLGEGFRALTGRLEQVIFIRYGLPAWTEKEHRLHKQADRLAAATEAVHVTGWTREEVRSTLKIRAQVLERDPLADHYGCTPWEPWAPGVAAERFLVELERLKRVAGQAA